jgi:glycerol kinase
MKPSGISVIALDLGTTSIKASLLDYDGELCSIVARPAPQISINGGHYESDALAYAKTAEQVLADCMMQAGECKSLSLCSQRSSFLLWDKSTGKPITALISWQDNRGVASCNELREHEPVIRALTGLALTPYYFAPKLRVVLQNNPDWKTRLENGDLLAGTLDTFMIWRLTGGRHFITDASMAARTLLLDIHRQQWSAVLCELFGIPIGILPAIRPSAGLALPLNHGLILQASVGDQSAALSAGVSEGRHEVLVNLGTGCFVMRYLPHGSAAFNGYLTTLVYLDDARNAHFAIEATLNSIVAALAPYPFAECRVEDLGADNIYCIAEPSGLGAPYFRSDIGIRYSEPVEHLTKQRIAALLLEAIIFRLARILEEFHREYAIERVILSGGLSELTCLQQGIAQCVPFEVYHLRQAESSLLGASLLATGKKFVTQRNNTRISPTRSSAMLEQKYRCWKLWLDGILSVNL